LGKLNPVGLFQFKHYLQHLLKAQTVRGHGVHSPFVYELVTEVLPDQQSPEFGKIESLRNQMLLDMETVVVHDLGAGSRVLQSPERKIRDIARHSLKNARMGRLLYRLARHSESAHLLELGTSLGITSAYLAATGKEVTTIEGCPNISARAQQNLNALGLSHVSLFTGNFDDRLPEVLDAHPECRYVFVDGNHSYEATMRYFHLLCDKLTNHSVIIFDDIYWSKGMLRAWKEIINHPKSRVTIDLFHLGLVYFKNEQAPEHFKIRL
jgi:predicted O-methyltransferase YrrM